MDIPLSKNKKSSNAALAHAEQQGAAFGEDILDMLKNWEGPASIAAITGYIASKNGIPIGNAQLSVGLGMIAAGAVAEAVSARKQHPEMDPAQFGKKVTKDWINRLQGPSNVSLIVGLVGMATKIKGSEAAFVAGAIGTALNISTLLYEHAKNSSLDDHTQR